MTEKERSLLDQISADNYAALYRCRWSAPDAESLVPKLVELLFSSDPTVVDEALRSLFRIGTPAVSAAPQVAKLTGSLRPITKRLAVLALGQIAHGNADLCVEALMEPLTDESCCRDVLRILAFIGRPARLGYDSVAKLYTNRDAKTRKAVIETAVAIADDRSKVVALLNVATRDRSKLVRDAAVKWLANIEGD
jgi:hypothetical protein